MYEKFYIRSLSHDRLTILMCDDDNDVISGIYLSSGHSHKDTVYVQTQGATENFVSASLKELFGSSSDSCQTFDASN